MDILRNLLNSIRNLIQFSMASFVSVNRRGICISTRDVATFNVGWILVLILISIFGTVAASRIPDKYPIEVYHMLQEKTQLSYGRDNRIKGSWGPWSSWSECSRSCGTGIQSQARECLPMRSSLRKRSTVHHENTMHAKPMCIGTYKRYHVCNTQDCPNYPDDFRAEQCAKYNGRIYKGQNYLWMPFPDAPNTCALNCRAIGERFYATLEPVVIDGTPCNAPYRHGQRPGLSSESGERWLCVAGQCKSVGCDGVVGSGVKVDACGVCGGEGRGCRLFEGIFMEPILPRGHQPVTTIPKGAMSLNISELRHTANFLALRDLNGSYMLNGPWSLSPSGSYKISGTMFSYQRGDGTRMENIFATGPLAEPLELEIFYQEYNPGIIYKYVVPLNETADNNAMIAPPLLAPGPNDPSNEIPDSSNRAMPAPIPRIFGHESHSSVPNSNYSQKESRERKRKEEMRHPPTTIMAGDQPNVTETGGKKKKKFSWQVVGLSTCSKTCGGGVQNAIFKCIREKNRMVANERRCRNIQKPPVPPPLKCNDRPCPARWKASAWSECSVSCGVGIQTRQLECVQELNSKLTMRVAAGACAQPPDLRTTQTCRRAACSNSNPELKQMTVQHDRPRWDVGTWGPCSATCGRGFKRRTVTCITSNDPCSFSTKPEVEKHCESAPCHTNSKGHAPWLFSEWSQECSAECGSGVRKRQVACADGSELFCNPNDKPVMEESCLGNNTNCDKPVWYTGPWSSCTVSCGSGMQYRRTLCIAKMDNNFQVLPEVNCNSFDNKPTTEQTCRMPACSAKWFTSHWSKCSQTCGTGVQERLVRCIYEGVTASGCSEVDEPIGKRVCNTDPCIKKDEIPVDELSKMPKDKPNDHCIDKYPNCNLVVKVGLCRIKYYKHSCCGCRD
ncbi:thrombospondin type-1 domain-containing protein 4 isoform X3 [Cephus cinctus]|nr:thrombospondin type-1 domain-containing protein 4 isoform X3 [Cephus cinctus]XP_024935786.1 thrombospondin type-1 domain-containing protein 4 isoform X3 [Cephus cinctus]